MTPEQAIALAAETVGPMTTLRVNGFDEELADAHRSAFGRLWLPDKGRFANVCVEPRDEEERSEARADVVDGGKWPLEAA